MLNLIWDLDGTLVDSKDEVFACLEQALLRAGIDHGQQLRPVLVGPTIDRMLRLAYPESALAEGKLEAAVAAFREIYDGSSFDRTTAFEGLDALLKDLGRFRHYVITNKPDLPSGKILRRLGWNGCVGRLLTPYTADPSDRRTKPELFAHLVESESLDPASTWGIGDLAADAQAARQAGIRSIGVLWGNGTAQELGDCDRICQTVPELSALLEELCQESS